MHRYFQHTEVKWDLDLSKFPCACSPFSPVGPSYYQYPITTLLSQTCWDQKRSKPPHVTLLHLWQEHSSSRPIGAVLFPIPSWQPTTQGALSTPGSTLCCSSTLSSWLKLEITCAWCRIQPKFLANPGQYKSWTVPTASPASLVMHSWTSINTHQYGLGARLWIHLSTELLNFHHCNL